MSDPEISIVIVSWNVRGLLIACLRSIERFVRTPHEVIVVDNHSRDGTVETVRREFPEVVVIANDANHGFARANNQGWQKSTGRYVCFLNPDTEMIMDPFPPIIEYVAGHQGVGCIGPELLNSDRSHQPSVRRFPRLADQLLVLLKLRWLGACLSPLRSYMPVEPTRAQPVEQVMGAALVFPRAVLERAGTFDEGYWIWFEEVDLCRRLHQRGYDVVYLPAAKIVHHGGRSFAQHMSLAKQVWFMKSLTRYANTFWSWPARLVLYICLPFSYLLTVVQSFFRPR